MKPRLWLGALLTFGILLLFHYGVLLRNDLEVELIGSAEENVTKPGEDGQLPIVAPCIGLAECALQWLLQHWDVQLGAAPVVLLYGRLHAVLPLARRLPAEATIVVAPLVAEHRVVPSQIPENVLIWSPPTEHKVRAFATSMNFLEAQILLEMPLLQAAIPSWKAETLLAHVFPMARMTFILLPCMVTIDTIQAEMQNYLAAQQWRVGPRHLTMKAQALHRLEGPNCVTLWRLDLVQMVRGVRHFWCFHNSVYKHKFDLLVLEGHDIVLRYIRGGKRKNLTAIWQSNLNMAEMLGWGLSRPYRKLLFWDALQVPQFSDSVIQNWVLCCGGHMRRIDTNSNRRMHGRSEYLGDLRQMLCLNDEDSRDDFPQCKACSACYAFSFHGKRKPPPTCTDCYMCAKAQVRALPLADLLQDVVVDCDTSYVNRSYRSPFRPMYRPSVGPNEHRCYPYPLRNQSTISVADQGAGVGKPTYDNTSEVPLSVANDFHIGGQDEHHSDLLALDTDAIVTQTTTPSVK